MNVTIFKHTEYCVGTKKKINLDNINLSTAIYTVFLQTEICLEKKKCNCYFYSWNTQAMFSKTVFIMYKP